MRERGKFYRPKRLHMMATRATESGPKATIAANAVVPRVGSRNRLGSSIQEQRIHEFVWSDPWPRSLRPPDQETGTVATTMRGPNAGLPRQFFIPVADNWYILSWIQLMVTMQEGLRKSRRMIKSRHRRRTLSEVTFDDHQISGLQTRWLRVRISIQRIASPASPKGGRQGQHNRSGRRCTSKSGRPAAWGCSSCRTSLSKTPAGGWRAELEASAKGCQAPPSAARRGRCPA